MVVSLAAVAAKLNAKLTRALIGCFGPGDREFVAAKTSRSRALVSSRFCLIPHRARVWCSVAEHYTAHAAHTAHNMGRNKDKRQRRRRTKAEIERDNREAAAGSKSLTSHFNQQCVSAPAAGPNDSATTVPVPPPQSEATAAPGIIDSAAAEVSSVLGQCRSHAMSCQPRQRVPGYLTSPVHTTLCTPPADARPPPLLHRHRHRHRPPGVARAFVQAAKPRSKRYNRLQSKVRHHK